MEQKVIDMLCEICETEEFKDNQEVRIFDEGLMDSLGVMDFMVCVEDQLGIIIPISDFDREEWATPTMMIENLKKLKG